MGCDWRGVEEANVDGRALEDDGAFFVEDKVFGEEGWEIILQGGKRSDGKVGERIL